MEQQSFSGPCRYFIKHLTCIIKKPLWKNSESGKTKPLIRWLRPRSASTYNHPHKIRNNQTEQRQEQPSELASTDEEVLQSVTEPAGARVDKTWRTSTGTDVRLQLRSSPAATRKNSSREIWAVVTAETRRWNPRTEGKTEPGWSGGVENGNGPSTAPRTGNLARAPCREQKRPAWEKPGTWIRRGCCCETKPKNARNGYKRPGRGILLQVLRTRKIRFSRRTPWAKLRLVTDLDPHICVL
jgi:hypothetical protein